MKSLFSQFNGVEIFFLLCALVGGMFVFFRLVMQMMGFGHDGDGDFGGASHGVDGHHEDSDIGFKLLSLHGLTSFLMMFGLVGLALYKQSGSGIMVSIAGAVIAGLASVWAIKKLFSSFGKLQSSGTISIENAIGSQGSVYLNIPKGGTGRVLVKVNNSLREFDAASADETTAIPTDTPIRVVWVDGNILVVEKI
ncbi:MAG: NfeD family protein [Proteobacteria bacterium]|nr:NfeD family protein [Pseudomonadota bacterium]MBU4055262.1 NfeD family protein [Pseudomonadota bacterium]